MVTASEKLIERLDELTRLVAEGTPEAGARAALPLRQTFLDGGLSLWSTVNREHHQRIRFEVNRAPTPSGQDWLLRDAFDPERHRVGMQDSLSLDQFLSLQVASIGGVLATVGDFIRCAANVLGVVHLGVPNPVEKRIAQCEAENPGQVVGPTMLTVGRIALRALRKLRYAAQGLSRFEGGVGGAVSSQVHIKHLDRRGDLRLVSLGAEATVDVAVDRHCVLHTFLVHGQESRSISTIHVPEFAPFWLTVEIAAHDTDLMIRTTVDDIEDVRVLCGARGTGWRWLDGPGLKLQMGYSQYGTFALRQHIVIATPIHPSKWLVFREWQRSEMDDVSGGRTGSAFVFAPGQGLSTLDPGETP